MKKLLLILISLSFYNIVYSQKYKEMMDDQNVNIYDVVKEARNYFKTHDKNQKGSGWKAFQRWLYENESKYYPTGDRKHTDPNLGVKEFLRFKNNTTTRNAANNNAWQELGPYRIDTLAYKPSAGIGRIVGFYVDPNDTDYMYISSRSGGLFKTTDGGVNWQPKTDYLFSTGVNNFDVSPSDRNEILINVNNSGNEYSNGIYKSTDGGDTWVATAFNPSNVTMGLGYDLRVRKIKYDPHADNIVFVGTNEGLYRSTDKLNTFSKIIDNVDVVDIAFHPTDPNIVYLYEKTIEPNKIHISSDQGLTFTLSNEIAGNNNAKNGIFSTSPACPDCVYFSSKNGVWKSTNKGVDFTFLSNPAYGNGGFAVSDLDNTIMLKGYINVARSTDDGHTFASVTVSSLGASNATDPSNSYTQFITSTNYVHVDLHPTKCINGVFYIGTDGWFCKSENNGDDWTILNQNTVSGTSIRENYRIGVSQSNGNRFITGCQDNGTAIKREEHWVDFVGGDGGDGLFHPLNYNWAIGSSQYALRNRTENGGYSKVLNFRAGSEEGSFVAPIVVDPNNQMTLYDFKLGVWKSEDFGDTWVQQTASVFPDVIKQAAIAENNSNIIIVSRNDKIKKSTDGGSTFVDIQNGLPNSSIRNILIDPNNDDRIFVLYNSYENNGEKIFMSEDGGNSWQNITYNLGNMPLRAIAIDDNQNIYVGAEIGIYTKPLTGTTWSLYNTNLPNVSINDLKIVTGTNTLRAATFGRGTWECKLIGKEDYPEIVKTEITDLPTKRLPKEGFDQYVYSEINYTGTLTNVEVRWSLNSVDFDNVIPMSNIGGNLWQSDTPLPNEVAGTKIYFKVFATGSNNDTSKTYKFMYTVKEAAYCNAIGNMDNNASITLVNFNTINNPSTKTNGYEDFTSISTSLTKGETYDLTVNVNTDGNVRYKTAAWIDWNHNYEFEDDERYYLGKIKNKNDAPTSLSPLSITVPTDIDPATVRMRIITKGGAEPVDPCRQGANGEVEDYTIVIVDNPDAPVPDVSPLPDITAECEVTSLTPPTATGSQGQTITGTSDATLPITTQGTTVITWTYDDGNGNVSTQTQNVIINDTTAPVPDVATLPDLTAECEVTSLTPPTATDNCSSNVTVTNDATLPITTQGTTVVTWTYDDGNGNTTQQTQNVIITPIPNTVTVSDNILTADASGYDYQWIDCDNNNNPIPGETNQSFTPTVSGNYAVIISNGNCSVTSDCINVTISGINDESLSQLKVYPNPMDNELTLDFGKILNKIQVKIINVIGQTISNSVFNNKQIISLNLNILKGIYYLKVTVNNNGSRILKIIKQ